MKTQPGSGGTHATTALSLLGKGTSMNTFGYIWLSIYVALVIGPASVFVTRLVSRRLTLAMLLGALASTVVATLLAHCVSGVATADYLVVAATAALMGCLQALLLNAGDIGSDWQQSAESFVIVNCGVNAVIVYAMCLLQAMGDTSFLYLVTATAGLLVATTLIVTLALGATVMSFGWLVSKLSVRALTKAPGGLVP